MAIHALDFDASSSAMGGHPAMCIASVFALAPLVGATGPDVLSAIAAGFEAQALVARLANPGHWERGWFTTTSLGTIGSSAAAAYLLRLDRDGIATAIGIGANAASGLMANGGTMAKSLSAGHCARTGIMAGLLARDGFTASLEVLEHRQGYLRAFGRNGTTDLIGADPGDPLEIAEAGVVIKPFPCCGIMHAAIEAAQDLLGQGLDPAEIERADVLLHPRRMPQVNRPDPKSAMDAMFCTQYGVAAALLRGTVGLRDFEGDLYRDPATRALMARLHVGAHSEMTSPRLGEDVGGEVIVHLRDGSHRAARRDEPTGRSARNPLPDAALDAKFIACATRGLPERTAAELLALLRSLDAAKSLAAVERLLTGTPEPAAAS
jgi:2-methylcitrate dehydratase PrpD